MKQILGGEDTREEEDTVRGQKEKLWACLAEISTHHIGVFKILKFLFVHS